VQDFSVPPNTLDPFSLTPEGVPDCTLCPPLGSKVQYVSTNCTSAEDRVCSACGQCGSGKYSTNLCTLYSDVTCKLCDVCPVGKYSSTVCGLVPGSQVNTVCSACTPCTDLQYEVSICTPTANTGMIMMMFT
jgi:hypothetical protein